MLLVVLAYLGGVLTILSPCILPVLPFVFARAGGSFLKSTLPLLAGMAVTFALVASLAAVGGGWAVQANQWGRWIALALLAMFGLALLIPSLAERISRPFVALGSRLTERASAPGGGESVAGSLLLGVATGLLWAPCAGPILGIIFTTAALKGASFDTSLLLFAYALGAATSLAAALLVGGKLFAKMKGSLGASERLRQALGVLVLAGVAVIALGLDTRFLASLSTAQTESIEGRLAAALGMEDAMPTAKEGPPALDDEGPMPDLSPLTNWINSPPLSAQQLKGKVVLLDIWTYSCINCLRTLPHVKAWNDRYAKDGLVIIGVHAPEFAFERDPKNVAKAVKDLGIDYPVALDNSYGVWRALKNRYWPAHYFIDAKGRIRHHHFGEGKYEQSEQVIRALLAEAGRDVGGGTAEASATGAMAAADRSALQSRETYVGYARAENFASRGGIVRDRESNYVLPAPALNHWGLGASWTVGRQKASAANADARIAYRFHARDLHLVLGSEGDKPVRFRITIDGKAPGADAGVDVDAAGNGVIRGQRLYQLARQRGAVESRLFEITFLDPGAEAYAFTFG